MKKEEQLKIINEVKNSSLNQTRKDFIIKVLEDSDLERFFDHCLYQSWKEHRFDLNGYLRKKYSLEETKNMKELRVINDFFVGHADLSDFPNLEEIILNTYRLTSLDLSKNNKLKKICVWENRITNNINIFSHLIDLEHLDLGREYPFGADEEGNYFFGSLKALENCKKLEHLCIGYQKNITSGLEYLPIDNLSSFGCHDTVFQDMLRPFDYDIEAWRMVNNLSSEVGFSLKLSVSAKLKEAEKKLAEIKLEVGLKQIQRLESKIKILKNKLQELKSFSIWDFAERTSKLTINPNIKKETKLEKALALYERVCERHKKRNDEHHGYNNCKSDACVHGIGTPCPKHKYIVESQREVEKTLYQQILELQGYKTQIEVPLKN